MLELDAPIEGVPQSWDRSRDWIPLARGFAYAGVGFALLPQRGLELRVPAGYGPYLLRSAAARPPTVARVTCAIHRGAGFSHDKRDMNRIETRWDEHAVVLRHPYFRTTARRVSPGQYAATARVGDYPYALAACLRYLSVALLEREAGLSMHAAALALDGRATILMGPSGAGKSTACELAARAGGARTLAYDQVAVFPALGRYHVWALPWGSATALRRSESPVLPLAACLRVTRGEATTRAWKVPACEAAFLLRAAVNAADSDPSAEARRLASVLGLAERVPVGCLATVLGQPTDRVIADFVRACAKAVA